MSFRPWRWLVFFFTRPIRLSDLSALLALVKPRPRAKEEAAPDPIPPPPTVDTMPIEVPRSPPVALRNRISPRADSGRSVQPSMFRADLEIGVSEQPLDTLPAELRDELQRPSTGRLQGSLRDG